MYFLHIKWCLAGYHNLDFAVLSTFLCLSTSLKLGHGVCNSCFLWISIHITYTGNTLQSASSLASMNELLGGGTHVDTGGSMPRPVPACLPIVFLFPGLILPKKRQPMQLPLVVALVPLQLFLSKMSNPFPHRGIL